MNDAARIVMNSFYETSTRNTIKLADKGVPPIPRGKQTYIFEVGQTVQGSGLGPIKAGVKVTIVERYKQHGYCYYRDTNGLVHREKDLTA